MLYIPKILKERDFVKLSALNYLFRSERWNRKVVITIHRLDKTPKFSFQIPMSIIGSFPKVKHIGLNACFWLNWNEYKLKKRRQLCHHRKFEFGKWASWSLLEVGGGGVIEDSLKVISFYLIRLWEKKNNRYLIKKKIIIQYFTIIHRCLESTVYERLIAITCRWAVRVSGL